MCWWHCRHVFLFRNIYTWPALASALAVFASFNITLFRISVVFTERFGKIITELPVPL